MPISNLAHVHPIDRACAFCLQQEGKDIPAELLVSPPAVRARRTQTRIAFEERQLLAWYRRLTPSQRACVQHEIHLQTARTLPRLVT